MTCIKYLILPVLILLLIVPVLAVPNTGAAYWVGSNNATINITLVTSGSPVWVIWGQNPGGECWNTANESADFTGQANITIYGAPLLGNTRYFAKACDNTGCGNEIMFQTAQITLMPATTYGATFRNLTDTHFNVLMIASSTFRAYTTVMPATVVFGLIFGVIVIGFWVRTKSVRLVSILFLIVSPFIMNSNAGLYLGIPLVEQALGQSLLAAGIAGILLSFVKK